jgi:GH18 family chitinase
VAINFLKNIQLLFLVLSPIICLNAQDFKTIGYFPTYRFHLIENIDFEKLTHLNIAFANPDANGQLRTDGVDISPVVQQAQQANVKVFIALAGGAARLSDWENWIKPANRSAFIADIIKYVHQHGLEGVDVDLEWGNVNEDYSGFVIELKDSIKAHGLEISVALPGIYRYPEVSDEALQAFDWINMMVYDLRGPWDPSNVGPHSPYSFAESAIEYWQNQGVELEKLTLGVPFYGYDFTNQNNVRAITYTNIIKMNPDYANLDQVGDIYYNGLPTIEAKTKLALEKLSGIMIWEIGQDRFDEYSLLTRISETIEGEVSTSTNSLATQQPAVVFPNPARNRVHIKLNGVGKVDITLLDLSGRMIDNWHINNQALLSIPIHQLQNGMYFIKIKTESSIETLKLQKL